VILDEHLHLLAELLLHGRLAFATQVRRRLADAAGYQRIALTRHFFCNATCGLVYCLSLYTKVEKNIKSENFLLPCTVGKSKRNLDKAIQ